MTTSSTELFRVAERLDESPMEMLNGGAADALRALDASSAETAAIASTRGIELSAVQTLWDRAGARLREMPEPDALFSAAAEAAVLLYTAAWVIESDTANTEDLKAVL